MPQSVSAKRSRAPPFKVTHDVGQIAKTVSIGVAFMNEMGDTGQAMLKRADDALYNAKNSGRNKVVCSETG